MWVDRRTDGQTDMVIPVYPPNFVAGVIKRDVCKTLMPPSPNMKIGLTFDLDL